MRQSGTGTCMDEERREETRDARGEAECEQGPRLGRHGDGISALSGLGFYLCPREGELTTHARTSWGLQHAAADLTVTVLSRGPRHAVIYNLSEARV